LDSVANTFSSSIDILGPQHDALVKITAKQKAKTTNLFIKPAPLNHNFISGAALPFATLLLYPNLRNYTS